MKKKSTLFKGALLTLAIIAVIVNAKVAFSSSSLPTNKFYLNSSGDLTLNSKVVVSGYQFYKIFNYDDFEYLIASSKDDKQLYLINKKNYKIKKITEKRPANYSDYYLDKCYLTYRYGKVYYLDGDWQHHEIKYSDGNIIKVLEPSSSLQALDENDIKFFGDNMYYMASYNYCHIDLKTAKKVIDIPVDNKSAHNQPKSPLIIYQDKNKLLYQRNSEVFLKKGEQTKKLFNVGPKVYLSYNNTLIDKNNYYFITGLSDGIILYDINNDSFKSILKDKILLYDIKEDEDKYWRDGIPNRMGHINEYNMRYINSNYDVKLFDLKTRTIQLLVPSSKISKELNMAINQTSDVIHGQGYAYNVCNISVQGDNVDISTIAGEGMQHFRYQNYRYNKKIDKLWLYEIRDDCGSDDEGIYDENGKKISK